MACRVCDQVGGPLPVCGRCGRSKAPRGRSTPMESVGGYCHCPGYYEAPEPGALWPGERWGDSLGHADWHEEG